eukprot:1458657-Pyramimonas_sp.AAC.1
MPSRATSTAAGSTTTRRTRPPRRSSSWAWRWMVVVAFFGLSLVGSGGYILLCEPSFIEADAAVSSC